MNAILLCDCVKIFNYTSTLLESLNRIFTITNEIKVGKKKIIDRFTNYKIIDNVIYLPKHHGLKLVLKLCIPYEDRRVLYDYRVQYNSNISLTNLQTDICEHIETNLKDRLSHNCVYAGAAGIGKCHGYDTKILLFEGGLKKVQDIRIGDVLMGDDFTGRTVSEITMGYGDLYNITNIYGDSYIVNRDHILCLNYKGPLEIIDNKTLNRYEIYTYNITNASYSTIYFNYNDSNKNVAYNASVTYTNKHLDTNVQDIPVYVYNDLPQIMKKYLYEVRAPTAYTKKCTELPPFLYGYWLSYYINIEIKSPNVVLYKDMFHDNTKYVKQLLQNIHDTYYYVELKHIYNLMHNKRISNSYMYTNRKSRVEFITGFVDGNVYIESNYYYAILKNDNEELLDDIIFIMRSVGILAYKKSIGLTSFCKLFIVGEGLNLLNPLKNVIKVNTKNTIQSTIRVTHIGKGNYYGFSIDGNKRYILHNLIVTHNTAVANRIINKLDTRALVIVPNLFLIKQWKEEAIKYLNISADEILIWNGSNKKKLTIYNSNFKLILCTIHMSTKIKNPIKDVNLTIYDEIHMYATKTFSETFWRTQSYYNLGLTATPYKLNHYEHIFIQHIGFPNAPTENASLDYKFTGEVLVVNNEKKYKVILSDTGVVSVPLMLNKLCDDEERNELIVKHSISLYNSAKSSSIYVMSERRSHLLKLKELILSKNAVDPDKVSILMGGSNDDDIQNAKDVCRIILTTYKYSSVGINIQKMNCMIIATPRKSNYTQILGRIQRRGSDYSITRKVVDIVDCNSIFIKQYQERLKIYNDNEYKITIQ